MRYPIPLHGRDSCRSALLLLVGGAVVSACSPDAPNPVGPLEHANEAAVIAGAATTISVGTSAELLSALASANAGTLIRLRAGSYPVSAPVIVPDGVVLEGEGVMQFDEGGRPTGFTPGTRTTLTMASNVPGNLLTLEDGAAVRRLAIEDLAGRAGNAVGVLSRAVGDHISASLVETEIVNPNPYTIVLQGSVGCGLMVFTQNPNLGAPPPPHDGATLEITMERSLIHSPANGSCGVFAFNFAPNASISLHFTNDVVGGGLNADGGVSRTDAVHDSRVRIVSMRTLYRDDHPAACSVGRVGWNLTGGSGAPVPVVLPATVGNTLEVRSLDDRIEGFATAVLATGARRFFAEPTAGPSSDNAIDLQLLQTSIETPACGTDLRLVGALAGGNFWPGDGNVVRALLRSVQGSGTRANVYADVLSLTGPVSPELQGRGNQLEIIGSLQAFLRTNSGVTPAPGAQFFTAKGPRTIH